MKSIRASVGLKGYNNRDDVRTVQELLNMVPHADGGPLKKLDADGICGRLTNGAIEKLQAHEWGWTRVDTRVDPNGPTLKLLQSYDKPQTAVVAPPKPVPPKIVSTRFIVMMAAKAREAINPNGENFYFQVIDERNQSQQAVYHFGNVNTPPPNPALWSPAIPAVVTAPMPLGAADWAGTGVFYEKQINGAMRTEFWIVPDALNNHMIRFGVYAHLDSPSPSADGSSSQFSAPFRLIDVSQGAPPPSP
jgi:hypothetical protein